MPRHVALLRGINVGGKNKLPMASLRSLLEALGLEDVETYIQSGNVVFSAPKRGASKIGERITSAIAGEHGFAPQVMVVSGERFLAAVEANPFPEGMDAPKSLHLFFCEAAPKGADIAKLDAAKKPNERYAIDGDVFYLHAPDGIGRSKLAGLVERALGVKTTARNGATVAKLVEMLTAS